ncbi:succinate dehydrogenase subunit 5, mitochondrial-like [Senna tora]|uniref:Succinate dehydrogenase subunit 5, mitochondrial-like n=1 Tax=Senna tora TaxID=362788 RepID=A0A834TXH5_9FABA|nr:succinate dehydrogenase subunit 5, mitochondrial-like [Senna tora]
MEKMVALRSLFRSLSSRSCRFSAINNHQLRTSLICRHDYFTVRTLFSLSPSHIFSSPDRLPLECRSPLSTGLGSVRFYSEDATRMPDIKDPMLKEAFKGLMAESWDELPPAVIYDVEQALSQNTDDKVGKDVVENVFRAAEAVEEFSGILVTLKMEMDDSIGMSGEDSKPEPDYIVNALRTVFDRYTTYLSSFGPDEGYLRKKVETELGSKMIHLKMRCSGLGSEWGKVTVLGTSGLAGSYVEQRS